MNRVKFLIICAFFPFCVGSRSFYNPEMCDQMKNISDCSFQFSRRNTCYVFEREECENFNFTSWNLKPSYQHIREDDAEFNVSVLPYTVYSYKIPLSAINITLTSRNEAITGFSLTMTEDIHQRNVCRIFDFRKAANIISVPFNFYYDCLYDLVERNWKNISMVFKAYPFNTELSYLVYIPSKGKAKSADACLWPPLIMVFRGSLPNYDVHVKFSNTPQKLNFKFFNVTLVDSFGFAIDTNIIHPHAESDMISCKFHVAVDGYYSVYIRIMLEDDSCPESKTDTFYVGNKIRDYSLILFIISTVLMILFISFLIYFSCLWYIKNASPQSKHTLLFVYSYKRLHHEFLVLYSRYLENQYGLKVNMIYEKCGNPKRWLEEKYSESDAIAFVVSPSLKTLDQGIAAGEHHWVDQLAEAKALIDNSYVGRKRICKVCFPYSQKEHMPKCLEKQGPLFMLPTDVYPFLCFIFNCPKKLHILSRLFKQNHHKVSNPSTIQNNNNEIEKKLQIIMKTAQRDSPILDFKSSLEEIKEKSKSSPSMQRNNVSDNILKVPNDGKLNFELQEASNETENDDFMVYCIRKILYSS